ncbi:Protein of unknown function [Mucilaginibacter mallensis]|uniref:DUF3892 domain-containing protein n=1 Tax=Mucilaginibacter mallensis TaxID=652787 RepID=A0A1H1PYJ5_MUCMA|nr:DUF3892 domain-containing protein [Mucilaginibacter mallensis]SDS16047.1 Protein of unknown function [Mucilaginibacter mallensis]
MANYKISGIWKDANDNNAITHYAFHEISEKSISRGIKTSKADAVRILSQPGNSAVTWVWDYSAAFWENGEKVTVVNSSYLRSNPDNKLTDNLAHLIDYDWLQR